jgi:uncharacterized membrane protein YfcA
MQIDLLFFFILFALSLSAFIKGSLGLGFSTICLAILANVIELKTAISIVLLPSLISNLIVMFDAGHWRSSIKLFWLLLLLNIPGMLIGLQLLKQDDNTVSVIILACVLLIYGFWGLRNSQFRIPNEYIQKLNPVIGFTTGLVNGATGSQIVPVMPYLLSLNISKEQLVLSINLSFTLNSLIMLGSLSYMGTLDLQSAFTYALGVIPVSIGVWYGNRVRKKLSDERYRKLVMYLIVALGGLLLLRSI